jgi:glycosyltransferase involved in cell wall biosynthesis
MRTNDSGEHKPKIILISPTAGTLAQFERAGFLVRQTALIKEYARYFDVDYYTSDVHDYSSLLGVRHHPLPIKLSTYGLRHLLFWIFLVVKAPFMGAPIRTFGVEIPTLPLVRKLSRQKVIAGFQWDYASQTRANYAGVKKWFANYLQWSGFRGADLVICTMDWLKEIAESKYRKSAVVLPNFIDSRVFHKIEDKEDYIVYAGRLHWSKGIEFLLAAFKEVVRVFPGYRLLVCGTGELDASLKQMVVKEEIPNVDFLGAIKQDLLASHLARAKVFVLPTVTYEGHPKALIEAMACGTACIASRVPGNRDVITDNVNGLLVEPRDSAGIFQALSRILGDAALRSRLESEASSFAKRYSLADVLREEVSLINSFCRRQSIPREF